MASLTREQTLSLLINTASHCIALPMAHTTLKRQCYYETIIGVSSFVSSFMYHTAEILDTRLVGMTPGNWHRLDNVFICLALVSLFLFFMNNTPKEDEVYRWGFVSVVLWFQEQGPWHIENMIAPIVLAALLCVGKYAWRRRLPHFLGQRQFNCGVAVLVVGSYFFVKGLDDEHDYLRFHHSVWHLCTGVAFYAFFHIPGLNADRALREGKLFTA